MLWTIEIGCVGNEGKTKRQKNYAYLESVERFVGSGVNSKDHASFTVAREGYQRPLWQENTKCVYSRSLFAIEPQGRAGVVDGETPLRDH